VQRDPEPPQLSAPAQPPWCGAGHAAGGPRGAEAYGLAGMCACWNE